MSGDSTAASPGGELGPVSWTWLDKGAGVVSFVFFLGYSLPQVRDVVAGADNVVLAPLDAVLPFFLVVLLLSVATGFYSTVLQGYLVDYEAMRRYRTRLSDVQERLAVARERYDETAVSELEDEQRALLGDQLDLVKLQFRPLVYVMLLTVPIFLWMHWKIRAGHASAADMRVVFPLLGAVGLRQAALGPVRAWLVWYLLCSMGFRQIIRKSLGVRTSLRGT